MAVNPFETSPKIGFFFRMLAPAIAIFGLFIPMIGVFSGGGASFEAAVQQKNQLVQLWGTFPPYCWNGKAVNEIQTRRCSGFWKKLGESAGVTAIPLGAVVLFYFFAFDALESVYRRGRKRIKSGKALLKGVVAEPAELGQDLFAWSFGLRVVCVQVKPGQQMRVYLPLSSSRPRPGETFAVFDGGSLLGGKRYLGMLYTPHVAVVPGGKN